MKKNKTNRIERIGAISIVAIMILFWLLIISEIWGTLVTSFVLLALYTITNFCLCYNFDWIPNRLLKKIIGFIVIEMIAIVPSIIIFMVKMLFF